MKFLSLAFVAGLVGFSTAAPAPVQEKRWPWYSVKPSYNHLFSAQHYSYNPAQGAAVFETYGPYKPSTSTISTFVISDKLAADWSGKNCRLGFWYDWSESGAGGAVVQVYSSLEAPPRGDKNGSNNRDNHVATWKVQKGDATEASGSPGAYKSFACPSAGSYAWEVVPTWGVDLKWNPWASGLYLAKV